MLFWVVAAVAERLVGRLAATAKSNAIADFISLAVGRLDRNPSAHPDWTAHADLRIFNQSDGSFEFRLKWFPGFFVPYYQTARGTVSSLLYCNSLGFRVA
jgi:hypothetical protein